VRALGKEGEGGRGKKRESEARGRRGREKKSEGNN